MNAVKVKHFVAVFKLFLLISSAYHNRELFSAHWAGYGAENRITFRSGYQIKALQT